MKTLKGMHKSLTIWFNTLLLAGLPAFELMHDYMPELQSYLPDNVYKWMGIVVVVGNIALRMRTTKPLAEK
jgi:hypothetical protein